tara:strand:- start:224 stop:535 length:312 start_codon:yes stop_codon:yes gene_type:complete
MRGWEIFKADLLAMKDFLEVCGINDRDASTPRLDVLDGGAVLGDEVGGFGADFPLHFCAKRPELLADFDAVEAIVARERDGGSPRVDLVCGYEVFSFSDKSLT